MISPLCPSFRCWDMNDSTALWWVIKGPVVGSIMVSILGAKRGGRIDREHIGKRKKGSLSQLYYIL